MVDYVRGLAKTELPVNKILAWLELGPSKYFDWSNRYGKANEHNHLVPRDHWLTAAERAAIVEFASAHLDDGYRRVTYMMMDQDIVAASPATVYRVLSGAGLLQRWNRTPSMKGTGFVQPLSPHEHWRVDVAYLNSSGTFYYLTSVLDGCSRYIVHAEVRESMTERDVELVIERAREKAPAGVKPRIITDNGSAFIARDFKEYIRITG